MEYFWYTENLHTNNAKCENFENLTIAKKSLQKISNTINEIIYLSYYLNSGIEKRLNIIPYNSSVRLNTIDYTI